MATITGNLANESIARQTADQSLQTQINAEVTTRYNADQQHSTEIDQLRVLYENLTQSDIIVGPRPSSGQLTNVIYREPDQTHTPPQNYSDYMWYSGAWVLMATYDNAIDDEPTAGSNNLVKSDGVKKAISSIEKKVLEFTNKTIAVGTYPVLSKENTKVGEVYHIHIEMPSTTGFTFACRIISGSVTKYVGRTSGASSLTEDDYEFAISDDFVSLDYLVTYMSASGLSLSIERISTNLNTVLENCTVGGNNIANPSKVLKDYYVYRLSTDYPINPMNGWTCIAHIPVEPNTTYYINGYGNRSDVYEYTDLRKQITYGFIDQDNLYTTSANCYFISINLNSSGTYDPSRLQINKSNVAVPYTKYAPFVISKDVLPQGGGENYDQSLNTYDSVEFASIKADAMLLDLPTSPTGLALGQAWVDTANGNVIKVV